MPKSRPPYPPEYRRKLVALVRVGRYPHELAQEFEFSTQTIRNWVAQVDADAGKRDDVLTNAEREERKKLRRENRQLKLEDRLERLHRAVHVGSYRVHRLHQPPAEAGRWLQRVVQGYFNYHAVSGNSRRLATFRTQVVRLWLRTLRRRSQRHACPGSALRGTLRAGFPIPDSSIPRRMCAPSPPTRGRSRMP